MDLNEGLKMKGELTIIHRDVDGNVKNSIHVPNLVVTAGKNFIASRMTGTTLNPMSHMAIGTSNATPAVADTTLTIEAGRATCTGSTTNNQVTYTATFNAGVGTGAIVEAGIFNAASAGTMLCRTTFPTVTKQASDTIAITWVVTVS
jgi:hypothetical protein